MTFADSQLTFVDLDGEVWGSFRLFIGQKDVTDWRGQPAQIAGYQLVEPYTFGPADFALPQLSQFEVDAWGTGDLSWFHIGAGVRLKQVDGTGAVVRTVWKGFVSAPTVGANGTQIHCEGESTGRLALRNKLPNLFTRRRHVGGKLFDSFGFCGLSLSPHLGGTIGPIIDGRGMTGTHLDYCDALLASTIGTDGSQYTIRAKDAGGYQIVQKDTSTTDLTVFLGAHGIDLEVSADISETPNFITGQGVAPNGLSWVNGKYPGLKQGDPPDYPMDDNSSFGSGTTDADTDSGDGVSVMVSKLVGTGYLDRKDKQGGFDADAVEAIEALQDDAGLTVSGNMNTATWDALFDINVTGVTLQGAFVAPLAESNKVRKWNYTSDGSRGARNPLYDPSVIPVDLHVDHGTSVEKSRARRYSKGVLHRAQNGKDWHGQLTLTADVFQGSHHSDDPNLDDHVMSRLDIAEGMNVMVRNFDGDTLFHVSMVNVTVDEFSGVVVQLGIDTKARDAATLGEVIARNIESKSHPARMWKRQHLSQVNERQVEFSEAGGLLWNTVHCPGNQWTVIPIPAGEAGNISRVRIQTENDEAEFVAALTAQKTGPAFWRGMVGNPFHGTGVAGIVVTDSGSGYTSTPTVSITGGGGSGATAVAHVGSTNTVTEIVLTNRGSGYTSAPTVSISGGGGSGADAHSEVTLNDPWTTGKFQRFIDHQRSLLGVWGTADQPCGYYPRQHTDSSGEVTDAPITGVMLEDAGIDYHTFADPVVYLAVFPDRDTVLKPQRILWDLMQSSQS